MKPPAHSIPRYALLIVVDSRNLTASNRRFGLRRCDHTVEEATM
jgi:hypothetical protein